MLLFLRWYKEAIIDCLIRLLTAAIVKNAHATSKLDVMLSN